MSSLPTAQVLAPRHLVAFRFLIVAIILVAGVITMPPATAAVAASASTTSFSFNSDFDGGIYENPRTWSQPAGTTTIKAAFSCNNGSVMLVRVLKRHKVWLYTYWGIGKTLKYTCNPDQTDPDGLKRFQESHTWRLSAGTYRFLAISPDGSRITPHGVGTVTHP